MELSEPVSRSESINESVKTVLDLELIEHGQLLCSPALSPG